MPELTTVQQFTRFGFIRRAHNADKTGAYANLWKGEILLTSESNAIDEIEAARNFEAIVVSGSLPMHGTGWRLAYINFNFSPADGERATLGAAVQCIVRIGYNSQVISLKNEEVLERLTAMNIIPETRL